MTWCRVYYFSHLSPTHSLSHPHIVLVTSTHCPCHTHSPVASQAATANEINWPLHRCLVNLIIKKAIRVQEQADTPRLHALQVPQGQQADEALAALQAEVRCIKHGSQVQDVDLDSVIQNLVQELNRLRVEGGGGALAVVTPPASDMVQALNAEIARLQRTRMANDKASQVGGCCHMTRLVAAARMHQSGCS